MKKIAITLLSAITLAFPILVAIPSDASAGDKINQDWNGGWRDRNGDQDDNAGQDEGNDARRYDGRRGYQRDYDPRRDYRRHDPRGRPSTYSTTVSPGVIEQRTQIGGTTITQTYGGFGTGTDGYGGGGSIVDPTAGRRVIGNEGASSIPSSGVVRQPRRDSFNQGRRERHIAECAARYESYDVRTDTYVTGGMRFRCDL